MPLPWILCAILTVTVIALLLKIAVMRHSLNEILRDVKVKLSEETNQLVTVSSRDPAILRLANELNVELTKLRKLQRQYLTGDQELKDAVTNISHDLRTPLTAICGYLDLMDDEPVSDEVRRYIERIRERTEALKKLTEELFRYSILTAEPALICEPVDIRRVLEESLISFYATLDQRGITPSISMPETAVILELDASALSRIFGNLIGNAAKYSDGDLCVTLTEDGSVSFSNTARSLSAVDVAKLFDRFYTVDSARHSTGLGLSIAKLLTERMGGSIAADYQNEALTVTLRFPT